MKGYGVWLVRQAGWMPIYRDGTEWRQQLLEILGNLSPRSFENLCRELLVVAGFDDVTVTGRPGDEGIDGRGVIRLAGLVSFPVVFQCKRYRRPVTAPMIRDFRGAMAGRTDKGLFITTSDFTPQALQEAKRDGVPFIDLIDGEFLTEKLRELGIGVTVSQDGVVEVNSDWFASL